MINRDPLDYLRFTAFVLTLVLVFYGFTQGFDTIELLVNVIYFIVIIVVLLEDNWSVFTK